MMTRLIVSVLVPVILTVAASLCLMAPAVYWQRVQKTKRRQSPLTKDLTRPPGHSLRSRIAELDDQIDSNAVVLFCLPLVAFAVHLSESYFAGTPESALRICAMVGFTLIGEWIIGGRLVRHLNDRRNARLGLEGEMFTGEELNQLMLSGCRVFHDIEFPYGNIDHVVVSHSGVYSINTKMIGKPVPSNDASDVEIDHPQGVIRFPHRIVSIPVEQLERESRWLEQHLTSAVGSKVQVEPMLALPGWFIKQRIGRGTVYVFNPMRPQKFFLQSRVVLSPEMVQRIAHQLEQLSRNVEPSFREGKGWKSKAAR